MKTLFKTKQSAFMNVPMSEILPNPRQSRMYFDDESIESLKNSIEEYGVLEPITVRKINIGYELICGERRFRAAQLAGLKEMPAHIIEGNEDKCAMLSLLENLQRQDLTFFEIAQSYERLMAEDGLTKSQIACGVGKSRSSVTNKLRLLKLSPYIRRMIREYDLTERHAMALLRLKDENERVEVLKRVCIASLTPEETNNLIDEIIHPKKRAVTHERIGQGDKLSFFKNTVYKAVDIMNKGGMDADVSEENYDWGIQYSIKVKNNKKE